MSDGTESSGPMTLSQYVWMKRGDPDEGHLVRRTSLPDAHPESWPSKYREAAGKEIPPGWREMLLMPSSKG